MKASSRIRILIADDHFVVREGLRSLIRREVDMVVAGEAANGVEAVEAHLQLRPDVTILDLRMPLHTGLEATRIILGKDPGARILMLSSFEGDEDIHASFEAGAMCYLLKHSSREIIPAIRSLMKGQKWISGEVSTLLATRKQEETLTPREREILYLIAHGQANKQIADYFHITEGTVKSHMTNILGKLQVPDRASAVTKALRRGIIHVPGV